jgi:hypothetical protein
MLVVKSPSVAEVQAALKAQHAGDELIPKYLSRLAQKLKQ